MARGGASNNGQCSGTDTKHFSHQSNNSLSLGPGPGIPRLGIRPYQWGTECLSGDVKAGPATSFPEAIGMVVNNTTVEPPLIRAL